MGSGSRLESWTVLNVHETPFVSGSRRVFFLSIVVGINVFVICQNFHLDNVFMISSHHITAEVKCLS
jgi:hypothetical protein